MKKTLLIEALRGETRLAVIEDDQLCELYVHRPGAGDAAGSIYLGRVENAVPGMNAAFVDIGAEKNGFLSASDAPDGALPRPGQPVLVQVSKVQSGQKGHRLTAKVTLPGRCMALLPGQRQAGVSRKLADPLERDRLRGIARALTGDGSMGIIMRTASEGVSEAVLQREFEALCEQWRDIEAHAATAKPPRLVYDNDSLTLRCVRELLAPDVDAVWADGAEVYEALMSHARVLAPALADRIRPHEAQTPVFDLYRVDFQLEKALRKYVWLKSGGSLVIEETEAMTVIDVNTAKFTGRGDLEDTVFRTNCEAAAEIVRQLRLRNLGGIIVVDFIDMAKPAHNEALLEKLRELAKTDRSRLTAVGMTGLGLVELTRKKDRRPLSKALMHTCSACGGDGMVPSHVTTARRAIREIWRRRRQGEANPMLLTACEKVIGWVDTLGTPEGGAVYGTADPAMGPGAFDIAPADEAKLPAGAHKFR